jgi:hypothetical protein
MSGIVGVGAYALYRRTSATVAIVQRVVEWLDQSAISAPRGIYWPGPTSEADLGLAHGVPGILAFLARCVRRGVSRDLADRLLRLGTGWFLLAERPGADGSRFPSKLESTRTPEESCRMAWCYGDLGIWLALEQASSVLDYPELRIACDRLSSAVVSRVGMTKDISLCHGAAGELVSVAALARGDRRPATRESLDRAFVSVQEKLGSEQEETGRCLLTERPGAALALLVAGTSRFTWLDSLMMLL